MVALVTCFAKTGASIDEIDLSGSHATALRPRRYRLRGRG